MTDPASTTLAEARAIVMRETLISMAINAAISAGFFFAVFGLGTPIVVRAFGIDFLPQAFMIALMGSLVPGLLVRRRSGAATGPIVKRALIIAIAALVVAGGGAFTVCVALGEETIAPLPGLITKILFGALLAAGVTPIAVRAALRLKDRV